MKVLVECSSLSNIGDGFYQLPLLELIKREFPNWDVYTLESPIYRSFKMTRQWHRQNALPLMNFQEGDLYVFSGPMLRQLLTHYRYLIESLSEKGKKYALVSCSCEVDLPKILRLEIGAFLKRYPPVAFSTRDTETFDLLSEYVENPFNGICTASLVDHYLKVDTPNLGQKYFVSSFYKTPEPYFGSNRPELDANSLTIMKRYTLNWLLFRRYFRHLEFLIK
jgi:hypothetical protein